MNTSSTDAMIEVIAPVAADLIAQELNERSPLACFRGLDIHTFAGQECPHTLREIGRLRELGFRAAGAGRNVDCDLDELDLGPGAYRQLIAWDPEHRQIVALYRYQLGMHGRNHGQQVFRTHRLFRYSERFERDYLDRAIELGRSVVNSSAKRRGLGLFALWIGLRALCDHHRDLSCFFGNVTLFGKLPRTAVAHIVSFLEQGYAPDEVLLEARPGLRWIPDDPMTLEPSFARAVPAERIAMLRELLRPHDMQVPPILQSYMGLGNDIWFGQTVIDRDFGNSLEIGIVVPATAIAKSASAERFRRTNPVPSQ